MWIDNLNYEPIGTIGFLICKDYGRYERIVIQDRPGCTNMSLEPRLSGWLGTTNDVSRHAMGVGKIVKTSKDGRRALVSMLVGDKLDAWLDSEGIEVQP